MRVLHLNLFHRSASAALVAITAWKAAAQSPLTRPIAGDSLYHLAVDSMAYKEYPFIYLLDDGVVRFEADGRGVEHYHQIVQILKPRGVEAWAERAFSYRPGHTKVNVESMRVVKPNGELISDKPNISQASDVPASMSNPVYSDTKVLRYSLGGVAVGTIVDVSWTQESTDPFLRGDFLTSWSTTMAYPAMRSRFVADLPASLTPKIIETHLDFKRVDDVAGGRHVYVWQKQSVMPVKGEIFAPDSSIPRASIAISSSLGWSDVARWYSGLAKDRYAMSPRAIAIVDSVTRPQKTASDTLRALHKWIAKDIRYVSVALGLSGYQPRFPDSTITSGFGDCKDKATLFIAAARHLGLTAYPVLLNSRGVSEKTLVSINQFDHAIAALPAKDGRSYTFLDLTTNAFPVGTVPPSYQGEFGLVVLPDGRGDEITFPKGAVGGMSTTFVGEATADGKVSGRLEFTAEGAMATGMRTAFLEPPDSAQRAAMGKGMGATLLNSTVDTVMVFDGRDPRAEAKVTALLHGGDGFKRAGPAAILTIPPSFRGPGASMTMVLRQLPDGERKYPIDASRLMGEEVQVVEFRLTLPEGWKAQMPKGVVATSIFGSYRSEYVQDGRVLRITRRSEGAKGVYPKERYADLKAWMKAIADDVVESIVLLPPPTP
jgi:hypothetical protein